MSNFFRFLKLYKWLVVAVFFVNSGYSEEDTSVFRFFPSDLGSCPSSLKNVDQIYVINLDTRPEKWKRTSNELEKFGLKAIRVSGVNGAKMDRELRKQITKEVLSWNALSDGQLGCFLSHLAVLKDAFNKQYKCVWVLEDDVHALEDLRGIDELIEKMDAFDPEWDLLFTNINNRINNRMDNPMLTFEMVMGPNFNYSLVNDPSFVPQENEDFRRIQYRLGTYSMIFSQRGVKKMVEYFQKAKSNFPIDMQIHCCPNRRSYVSKKEYVFYDKIESDT
jgi:GR25 family glycosyltransferase involved in LPS biosynthesis